MSTVHDMNDYNPNTAHNLNAGHHARPVHHVNGVHDTRGTGPTAVICGIGRYLPPRVLTNEQIIKRGHLDTTAEWIKTRTGIERRRYAAADVSTGDMATAAARAAFRSAVASASSSMSASQFGLESGFVPQINSALEDATPDALLLATTTPDRPCPATAPEVAHRLGLGPVPAFDLSAVCSGFLYALATAAAFIRAGLAARPLVVAAEKYSTIIDPCDRGTAPVFADGAAAVLLRAGRPAEPGAVLAVDWGSDGSGSDLVAIAAGGSRTPATGGPGPQEHYFRMRGGQVYAHAVRRMTQSARAALASTGWKAQDVEAFIGHQANQRILDSVADRLGIDARHNLGNIRDVGNTAAASIPLALADAVSRGACRPGAPTLLTAFGGGLTWASVTLHWPGAPVFQSDAQPYSRSEPKERDAR